MVNGLLAVGLGKVTRLFALGLVLQLVFFFTFFSQFFLAFFVTVVGSGQVNLSEISSDFNTTSSACYTPMNVAMGVGSPGE